MNVNIPKNLDTRLCFLEFGSIAIKWNSMMHTIRKLVEMPGQECMACIFGLLRYMWYKKYV